jgi:hypothetical protein
MNTTTTIDHADLNSNSIKCELMKLVEGLKEANDKMGFIHNRLYTHNLLVNTHNSNIFIQDFRDCRFTYKGLNISGVNSSTTNNDLCTLLYQVFTPEYFHTATDYKANYADALTSYVNDSYISQLYRQVIYDNIRKAPSITRTVYRGQKSDIQDTDWFSTSKRYEIAEKFAHLLNSDSNIFIIHLIDVPAIDVNEVLLSEAGFLNTTYDDEEEILVLGGGEFYNSADLTNKGMKINKTIYKRYTLNIYETWYTMDEPASAPKRRSLRRK